jgi:DNA-binding CsgD family transcriptional regulator
MVPWLDDERGADDDAFELPEQPFVGRDAELGQLRELLMRARHGEGGARLIVGDPGIGKSAILSRAAQFGVELGMQTHRFTGVQSETQLPFAGLHQLVRPKLDSMDRLPARQRAALAAAFGMAEGDAPDLFLIALATLDLLSERASDEGIVLIVDDGQWVDRSTVDVLTFLARRLESDSIALLVGVRSGYGSPLLEADLPELRIGPLEESEAAELLKQSTPGLGPRVGERLLAMAAGNPLALIELPAALRTEQRRGRSALPSAFPLTDRLERTFAGRVKELPPATRHAMVVAAADDSDSLQEILAAAKADEDALAPAVRAGLLDLRDATVTFRHPLVRSAVYQAASVTQRHAAHSALAGVLRDQPDREVWHRAASKRQPDEETAARLEQTATRAMRRGATPMAVDALELAAALTPTPEVRGARLVQAAELTVYTGRRDQLERLVAAARPLPLRASDQRRLTSITMTMDIDAEVPAGRSPVYVKLADESRLDGDDDLAWRLLHAGAVGAWNHPDEDMPRLVVAAVNRMTAPPDDPRRLSVLAIVDPVKSGTEVIFRLSSVELDPNRHPMDSRLLGQAAHVVGDLERSAVFMDEAIAGLRAQGRLGYLASVLAIRAAGAFQMGDHQTATGDADEAVRLAKETAQPIWEASALLTQALLRGRAGDRETAYRPAAAAERIVFHSGESSFLAAIQQARGTASIGAGDHEEAYHELRRMFERSDPAFHPIERWWGAVDLAESAARTDARDEARTLLADLEAVSRQTPSPALRIIVTYAKARLADDVDAEDFYRRALRADLGHWPYTRARLQLAYGEWLRRQRRVAESRAPLRVARDVFDALGVAPWGERARVELRAAGETSHARAANTLDELTAQELQIAQLASEGLSNREIGQRLYLSHRTVGSHLYRIFPKLGVTSRAQLRSALDNGPNPPG